MPFGSSVADLQRDDNTEGRVVGEVEKRQEGHNDQREPDGPHRNAVLRIDVREVSRQRAVSGPRPCQTGHRRNRADGDRDNSQEKAGHHCRGTGHGVRRVQANGHQRIRGCHNGVHVAKASQENENHAEGESPVHANRPEHGTRNRRSSAAGFLLQWTKDVSHVFFPIWS